MTNDGTKPRLSTLGLMFWTVSFFGWAYEKLYFFFFVESECCPARRGIFCRRVALCGGRGACVRCAVRSVGRAALVLRRAPRELRRIRRPRAVSALGSAHHPRHGYGVRTARAGVRSDPALCLLALLMDGHALRGGGRCMEFLVFLLLWGAFCAFLSASRLTICSLLSISFRAEKWRETVDFFLGFL